MLTELSRSKLVYRTNLPMNANDPQAQSHAYEHRAILSQ